MKENMTTLRVIELKTEDLGWPFDGTPQFQVGPPAHYRNVKVDPFPCYAHDRKLVQETADQVEAAFPIVTPPTYYLLHHEAVSRTSGHSDRAFDWDDRAPRTKFTPWIVLSGKRIPIHPAMTRYLVAHEYGHVVQWAIEALRRIEDHAVTEFDREYMKMRPEAGTAYGGRKWHAEVGELIANDFRICVTGIETEFWPHPGFEHPLKLDAIRGFWARMVEEHAFRWQAAAVGVCDAKVPREKEWEAA
jgi:hypothetical protein